MKQIYNHIRTNKIPERLKFYNNTLKHLTNRYKAMALKKMVKSIHKNSSNETSISYIVLHSLHWHWLVVHILILVLNCNSYVSSLIGYGISFHISGYKDERLSLT